jgi:hypothetical protein
MAYRIFTRRRTLRQDQSPGNSPFIRVNKRCLGTLYKPAQPEILSRGLDRWGECFASIWREPNWYWLGRRWIRPSAGSLQRHILAPMLYGQMAEDGHEYQHAWSGGHSQRVQSDGTDDG